MIKDSQKWIKISIYFYIISIILYVIFYNILYISSYTNKEHISKIHFSNLSIFNILQTYKFIFTLLLYCCVLKAISNFYKIIKIRSTLNKLLPVSEFVKKQRFNYDNLFIFVLVIIFTYITNYNKNNISFIIRAFLNKISYLKKQFTVNLFTKELNSILKISKIKLSDLDKQVLKDSITEFYKIIQLKGELRKEAELSIGTYFNNISNQCISHQYIIFGLFGPDLYTFNKSSLSKHKHTILPVCQCPFELINFQLPNKTYISNYLSTIVQYIYFKGTFKQGYYNLSVAEDLDFKPDENGRNILFYNEQTKKGYSFLNYCDQKSNLIKGNLFVNNLHESYLNRYRNIDGFLITFIKFGYFLQSIKKYNYFKDKQYIRDYI